jgi:superkiller protein 3
MKLSTLVTAFGAMLVANVAIAQQSPLQQAAALFRAGQFEMALPLLQQARREQPENAVIVNLIGLAETGIGRIAEANADYEAAIRLDPKLAGPQKNLGFNYLNQKQYALAATHLKAALALNDSDPFPHYYLAIVDLKSSQEAEACVQFKSAESLIENDSDTAFLIARACLDTGDVGNAKILIEAAETRSGFSILQEYGLARLMSVKGWYADSVDRFTHLVKMQPNWVNKYNLAIAMFQANQPANAIPLLESVVAERPADPTILGLLGTSYEAAGKLADALDAYRRAVEVDPEDPDRYLDYSRLLIDLDRYDEASDLVQRGLHNTPGDAYALNIRLGAVQMMEGNYTQARLSFQKGIDEHPEIPLAYIALADTYLKQGDGQTAEKRLIEARSKLDRDFALEYVFGLVSFQLGKTAQAIEALNNAEQAEPSMAQPHYQLGRLYMDGDQWTAAKSEFERVLQLDASNAQAIYQLSRVYARLGDRQRAKDLAFEASRLIQEQRQKAIQAQEERMRDSIRQ